MTKIKIDSFITGLISAIILPLITLILLYFIRFGNIPFAEFINRIIVYNVAGKILSLCAIPNLLLFFLFIWLDRLKIARGVIGGTFIITLFILIIKLF